MKKAWEKTCIVEIGYKECRIYGSQGHFAETRR